MNDDPDGDSGSRPSQRIECRPHPGNWLVTPFLVLAGLFPFCLTLSPDPPPFDATFYAACALWAAFTWPLPLGLIWWLLRGFIIADATGVSWRGMGRRRSATWPEVEEYWLSPVSGKRHRYVKTAYGKFCVNRDLPHADELCAFIQEHAQWAKSRQWQIKEPDFAEGRHEFAYGPGELRTARVFMVAGALCIPLLLLPLATSPRGIGGIWQTLGEPFSLIILLSYLGVALLISLVCIVPYSIIAHAIVERRDQHISTAEEGLTFESRDRFIRARWDEVTDYYSADIGTWLRLPSRYVVVTKSGTFDFVRIDKTAQLCALIKRYATHAAHSTWQHERTLESLVREDALWSGGQVGVGQRVYGYRNRTARALLFFGVCLSLMFLTLSLLGSTGLGPYPRDGRDPVIPLVVGTCLGMVALLGLAAYYRTSLRTDERGLEKRTLFAQRFLAWSQVREIKHIEADLFSTNVVKGDITIRFSPLISDAAELYEEIARRTGLEW